MFVCFFSRYVRRPDTEDWYKDDEEGNEVVENGGKLEWHFTNMYHQLVNTVGLWLKLLMDFDVLEYDWLIDGLDLLNVYKKKQNRG